MALLPGSVDDEGYWVTTGSVTPQPLVAPIFQRVGQSYRTATSGSMAQSQAGNTTKVAPSISNFMSSPGLGIVIAVIVAVLLLTGDL